MNNGSEEACVRGGLIRRSLNREETFGIQGRPRIKPEDILGIADLLLPQPLPRVTISSLAVSK